MRDNTIAVVSEIWNLVREVVPANDLAEVAETIVSVLIDYDYALEEIRHEFNTDPEILDAVSYFDETTSEEEPEYEEYSEEDDDGDW